MDKEKIKAQIELLEKKISNKIKEQKRKEELDKKYRQQKLTKL